VPFQSEKQRRFLHANHPEIAKRWEREYANGGISNHFRKKFDKGSDNLNNLSTGVKGLFQAKNGGMTIQGGVDNWLGEQKTVSDIPIKWKSQPGAPKTELAYITKAEKDLILKKDLHGSLKDGPNIGPNGVMSLDSAGGSYGSPGSGTGRDSPGGVGYGDGPKDPVAPPAVRQKQIKDLIDKADEEKYDTDLKGMSDAEKYAARRKMIKEKYISTSDQRSGALTKNFNTEKARLEKKLQRNLLWILGPAFLLGAPVSIKDFVGIDWKNKKFSGPLKTAMTLDQLKKQQIADLTVEKESLLAGVDINNPNTMKNLDDTNLEDINKQLKELTKTRDEEDDTGGDGPPTIELLQEKKEEIEDWDPTDWFASLRSRIKEGQQKRAMLVEKGIIQDEPIALANSGGLANLFRVKNQ